MRTDADAPRPSMPRTESSLPCHRVRIFLSPGTMAVYGLLMTDGSIDLIGITIDQG